MAYTKENILDEIRALLNEPTAQFYSDAEINEWIDQAAIDISSKTLCDESSDTITLVSGQLEYTKPTGCIKIYACRYGNVGLMKINPRQIAHVTAAAGAPQFYYEFAGNIGIFPVAGAAQAATDVTVLCSLQTDDITDIADEYQPYAILFGVYKAKQKDGKYDQAAQILVQYLNSLIFHRQDLYDRGVDSKDMFKIPDRTVMVGQQ